MPNKHLLEGKVKSEIQQDLFSFDSFPVTPPRSVIGSGELERNYGQYIVYVDESGDHSLEKIDENYPVFVLSFCVFHKQHYTDTVCPLASRLKLRHFGHDMVILHEADIKKENAPFNIFKSSQDHQAFINELTGVIEQSNFILIACTIYKKRLPSKGVHAYHLALRSCMQALFNFLKEKNQHEAITHIVLERRGAKEDKEVELEFRRLCDEATKSGTPYNFEMVLADKKTNSIGLQIADLTARPIGRHCIDPTQPNRAFNSLVHKFYCAGGRHRTGEKFRGIGLLEIPPESERPR